MKNKMRHMDLSLLTPSPAVAGGKAGPRIMKVGELALTLKGCSLGRAGPAPHLAKRAEVTLVVGVWVCQPKGTLALTIVCISGVGDRRRERFPFPKLSPPTTGKRTGPVFHWLQHAGKQALSSPG